MPTYNFYISRKKKLNNFKKRKAYKKKIFFLKQFLPKIAAFSVNLVAH